MPISDEREIKLNNMFYISEKADILSAVEAVKGGEYPESFLQELIRKHPEVLYVDEIEPIFLPMIPIGREVQTITNGYIDNLYISSNGYLTLVETKLWKNPEAKREVITQIIDYGCSIAKWNYERIDAITREYTKHYEKKEYGLVQWINNSEKQKINDEEYFREIVNRNLRLGRYLLLIVGDRIRHSVGTLLDYVNERYPGFALSVSLMELQGYRQEKQKWPLLLIPRVVTRTEVIERSVVQVTLLSNGKYDVDVKQEQVSSEQEKRKRLNLTEEAFFEKFSKYLPEYIEKAKEIIPDVEKKGCIIEFKEDSYVVKYPDPGGSGRNLTLFYINTKGKIHLTNLNSQLRSIRLPEQIAFDHAQNIAQLFKCKVDPKHHENLSRPIEIKELSEKYDGFINIVQSTITKVNDESKKLGT